MTDHDVIYERMEAMLADGTPARVYLLHGGARAVCTRQTVSIREERGEAIALSPDTLRSLLEAANGWEAARINWHVFEKIGSYASFGKTASLWHQAPGAESRREEISQGWSARRGEDAASTGERRERPLREPSPIAGDWRKTADLLHAKERGFKPRGVPIGETWAGPGGMRVEALRPSFTLIAGPTAVVVEARRLAGLRALADAEYPQQASTRRA